MTPTNAIDLTEVIGEAPPCGSRQLVGCMFLFVFTFAFVTLSSTETKIHVTAYAACGLLAEIVFTGIARIFRDGSWDLEGFTSLWAAPLYGTAALLFEPLYCWLKITPAFSFYGAVILRGMFYIPLIFTVEVIYLSFVWFAFRIKPWKYVGSGALFGGRLNTYHAPLWFLLGIGMEYLADFLRLHVTAQGIHVFF